MEQSEFNKIKMRFEALYWVPWNESFKQPVIEWGKYLSQLDYSIANETIDRGILQGYPDGKGNINTKMPSIPEYNALYLKIKRDLTESEPARELSYCPVCEGKGFIPHTKAEEYETVSGKIVVICREYILYCTECTKGDNYKYDERNNSERKTKYIIEPVTKYYSIDQLKAENSFKNRKAIRMPDYVLKEAKKHGIDIRRIMNVG